MNLYQSKEEKLFLIKSNNVRKTTIDFLQKPYFHYHSVITLTFPS